MFLGSDIRVANQTPGHDHFLRPCSLPHATGVALQLGHDRPTQAAQLRPCWDLQTLHPVQKNIQIETKPIVANDDVRVGLVQHHQEPRKERSLVRMDRARGGSMGFVPGFHLGLQVEGPGCAFELPHRREAFVLVLRFLSRSIYVDRVVGKCGEHHDLVRVLAIVLDGLHVQTHYRQRRRLRRINLDHLERLGIGDADLVLTPAELRRNRLCALDVYPARPHQIPFEQEELEA